MSFRIDLDPFEEAYARFLGHVRAALQKTYAEEAAEGFTQRELAETLGADEGLVSRRLNHLGNVTLRTLCDLYTAMGREPLSNFQTQPYSFTYEARPTSSAIGPVVDLAMFRSTSASQAAQGASPRTVYS